jgi:hypothetical protein
MWFFIVTHGLTTHERWFISEAKATLKAQRYVDLVKQCTLLDIDFKVHPVKVLASETFK